MEIGETLEVSRPDDFGNWLDANAPAKSEIWVVIFKKASGKQTVTYPQLVEVGIAYGWIDSQSKGVDEEHYAIRFSPRRPNSNWTEANKDIARRLIRAGKMTLAGKTTLPDEVLAQYTQLTNGQP
jgi:uncharacterized protein YdeI (YjbR/CyaY-like superfamily)